MLLLPNRRKLCGGLSLVELLAVVVIILSFSMVVITVNSNATRGAEEVTYQQQKAQLQKALGAWVASQPSLIEAIRTWNSRAPTADSMMARTADDKQWLWPGGPMSLLSSASHKQFRRGQGASYITTHASRKIGRGFAVSWAGNDPARMYNEDPEVLEVVIAPTP